MKLSFIALALLTLLTLLRFSGNTSSWTVDLLSHFPVQYGLLCLALVPWCMTEGRTALAIAACTLALVNLSVLDPLPAAIDRRASAGTELTVYSANIWKHNPLVGAVLTDISTNDPDVVFLVEATPAHAAQFKALYSLYPYRHECLREGFSGFIFLSRWPLESPRTVDIAGEPNRPAFETLLNVRGRRVRVFGMHPHAPSRPHRFLARNRQLDWLARHSSAAQEPVIVLGDLNVTPFAPSFRRFLAAGGLRDARTVAGWRPSWPSFIPRAGIPIDHVLVSDDIAVHRLALGRFIGSDHLPVVAKLAI